MQNHKTWREKLLDSKDLPRIEKIAGKMTKAWGEGTIVMPAPIEIDAIMRGVPKGKLITLGEIQTQVAKKHKATIGCPITAGVFAGIAANAAEEALLEGEKRITPYWRTLKTGGELNSKYPGGLARSRELLEAEGHKVVAKGKRLFVEGFEQSLASQKPVRSKNRMVDGVLIKSKRVSRARF